MKTSPAIAGLLLLTTLVATPGTGAADTVKQARVTTCRGLEATILGTDGSDVIVGTSGPDVIMGFKGNDTIRGRKGDDVVCGGRQDDRLHGGEGDDRLYGQENKPARPWGDRFYDGPGDDYMHGGHDSGYDYLYYNEATSGVVLDRETGTVTGDSSGNDTFELIGVIFGSPYDDIMSNDEQTCEFSGGAGDDVIDTIGECVLDGGDGDDVLSGGGGVDDIYGGLGDDSLYGFSGDDYLYGGDGADYGDGSFGTDQCQTIEEAVDCEISAAIAPRSNPRSTSEREAAR